MKWLSIFVLFVSMTAFAHEHPIDLKGSVPLPGSSIFQLSSNWKDQHGKEITISSLNGKPRLVIMLFTKCETACPLIVEDLKEIVRELPHSSPKIAVSLFSLDSQRETPGTLTAFAIKRKIPEDWGLFTANSNAVAELAGALGVRYKRLSNGDYIHSNIIYFLNEKGEIVAQKEGLNTPRKDFLKQIQKNILKIRALAKVIRQSS